MKFLATFLILFGVTTTLSAKKKQPASVDRYFTVTNEYSLEDMYKYLYKKYFPSKLKNYEKYKTIADGKFHPIPVAPLHMWVAALPTKKFLVITYTTPGGVAEKYKLKKHDEIVGVNGTLFKSEHSEAPSTGYKGPIYTFATALEAAQAVGKISLLIKPLGSTKIRKLTVPIERLGRFAKNYPIKCRKSLALQKELSDKLTESGGGGAVGQTLNIVAQLSTGDKTKLDSIKDKILKMMGGSEASDWNEGLRLSNATQKSSWRAGCALIALAEYFWATGDEGAFSAMQNLADEVNIRHQHPFGGFGHGMTGTYANISFGAPGPLNILGLSLAEKCGVKVDHTIYERYYNILNKNLFQELKKEKGSFRYDKTLSYQVSYGSTLGVAKDGKMGQRALNTAVTALALGHMPPIGESRALGYNLAHTIANNHEMMAYVHTTPFLGMFWSVLAQRAFAKETLRNTLDYRKGWLTLSRFPNKIWYYVYPKRNAAGAYGGDGYISQENCQLTVAMVLLTSYRKNLLMLGNKKRNWMTGKDVSETLSFVKKYHSFYAKAQYNISANMWAQKTKDKELRKENYMEVIRNCRRIIKLYNGYAGRTSCAKLLSAMKAKLGASSFAYYLHSSETVPYFAYLRRMSGRIKMSYKQDMLDWVMRRYPKLKIDGQEWQEYFDKKLKEREAKQSEESDSEGGRPVVEEEEKDDDKVKKKKKKKKKKK